MLCPGCKKREAKVKLSCMPRALCPECFCRNIERRIRKQLRLDGGLSKHDTLVVVDDGSYEARVAKHVLEGLRKDFPFELKIVKRVTYTNLKGAKLVSLDNLEHTAVKLIKQVILPPE
ncbi:hypothetical protein KY318_03035, partial [Candidatus Woesearchaeota archaeon]|nr:hypothetical protein [Candidatus Woesearchaeota archaeon]